MDEESKQLLKDFEKEVEQDIPEPVAEPVEEEVEKEKEKPVVDWKGKHDALMEKYNLVAEEKDEYTRLIDKQMSMMRYMCAGAEKIGMKFDEMHMIGSAN
jgi:hypothetical protein